jgi:hypothetical protein
LSPFPLSTPDFKPGCVLGGLTGRFGVWWVVGMSLTRSAKDLAGRLLPRLRDYSRIRAGYSAVFGAAPNVLFPKTFCEKVQHRKLFERDPRMPERADKISVKDFVESKLGPGWTTPTIWFGPELPDRQQRTWPIPFVIKASHGSTMNVFVRETPDWDSIENLCHKWLNEAYGEWGGEWLYTGIKPRLLVEPFIGELSTLPLDYKMWVFNGRVEFIAVDTGREKSHKRTIFDRDWNVLPFTIGFPIDPMPVAKPA